MTTEILGRLLAFDFVALGLTLIGIVGALIFDGGCFLPLIAIGLCTMFTLTIFIGVGLAVGFGDDG